MLDFESIVSLFGQSQRGLEILVPVRNTVLMVVADRRASNRLVA